MANSPSRTFQKNKSLFYVGVKAQCVTAFCSIQPAVVSNCSESSTLGTSISRTPPASTAGRHRHRTGNEWGRRPPRTAGGRRPCGSTHPGPTPRAFSPWTLSTPEGAHRRVRLLGPHPPQLSKFPLLLGFTSIFIFCRLDRSLLNNRQSSVTH